MKNTLKNIGVNKVIVSMIWADTLLWSGLGLVAPFLTVFIADEISGGTLATAGFATTIYMLVRAIVQLPVASYVDKMKGEMDDYVFLVGGTVLTAVSYLMYAYLTTITQVYIVQIVAAIGSAMATPTWYAIFTNHMAKKNAAFQWTMYDTIVTLGTALSAGMGGLLITYFDYRAIFVIVSIVLFVSCFLLFGIKDSLHRN